MRAVGDALYTGSWWVYGPFCPLRIGRRGPPLARLVDPRGAGPLRGVVAGSEVFGRGADRFRGVPGAARPSIGIEVA